MTTTDAPATAAMSEAPEPGSTPDAAGAGGWRTEALLLVEVAALAAFAFSRPVLDSFGRSPETFIARNADAAAIVWFGVIVSFVPALVLGAVGTATRLAGPSVRRWAHIGLVGVLGGMVVWRLGQDITGWPGDATKLILAFVLAVPLAGVLRWKVPAFGTFLRYAGVASLLFLGQFLVTSPSAALVLGDGPELDDEVSSSVAAQLGDDAPDVMFVVFDALPTESLLDGTGHIDAATYPNLGRVAEAGTWYRNNTSNAIYTSYSIPAILTGRMPDTDPDASREADPENLFTLLGGAYDVQAVEQVTNLCPEDVCVPLERPGVGPLLGDAVDLWWDGAAQADDAGGSDVPGALETNRYPRAERWIEDIAAPRGDRPRLVFQHIMLPHGPFTVTDDGTPYAAVGTRATGLYTPIWAPGGAEVGRQRHLLQLQAADRLLGQILDRLDAEDAFDDTLLVVTADHGEAFLPGEPDRQLTEANAASIAWTPLIIKAPGQSEGRIDDANVQAVDIVPTLADLLGVDLPWDVDGFPVDQAAAERDDTKPIADFNHVDLKEERDVSYVELDGPPYFAEVLRSDAVIHDGPEGVWRRTAHGALFGQDVDDLDVAESQRDDVRVAVDRLADLESGDEDPPLIEVVGVTDLPAGTVVAYAVDGTVAALTEVGPGVGDGVRMAHALVPPSLVGDGPSELTAYVVTGDVGHEILTPIGVDPQ